MKKVDIMLFAVISILTLFGLLMIYDASSVIAFRDFGDKYHYIKDQSLWVVLGFAVMIAMSQFDYRKLYNFALPLLVTSLILLVVVFFPGLGVYALGAHRWINLRFTILQPAEFVKLCLAIYLAAWFSIKEKGRLTAFALLLGAVILLVMLEPDMGTASIILFEAIVIYFLSGGKIKHFILAMPILAAAWFIFIKVKSYRAARLTSFLNLNKSLDGVSYHVKQILIALGSGGIFGVGIGNSLQKYAYLPENVTDSIFPIIAEEFGFIGSVILITLFMVVVWRGFFISMKAKDQFGRLLGAGIITFLGIQMIVNLGAMTALLPLTGVPLPFISYGGSALIIDMASIGILLNISRQSAAKHNSTEIGERRERKK
jgi:cell division protein FtsW